MTSGVVLNRFDVVYFTQTDTAGSVTYFPSWAEFALMAGLLAFALLVCRAAILYLPIVRPAKA